MYEVIKQRYATKKLRRNLLSILVDSMVRKKSNAGPRVIQANNKEGGIFSDIKEGQNGFCYCVLETPRC